MLYAIFVGIGVAIIVLSLGVIVWSIYEIFRKQDCPFGCGGKYKLGNLGTHMGTKECRDFRENHMAEAWLNLIINRHIK